MAFDIEGARKAGYGDDEIADYLAGQANFDAAGARKAGYSAADIVSHLTAKKPVPEAAPHSSGAPVGGRGMSQPLRKVEPEGSWDAPDEVPPVKPEGSWGDPVKRVPVQRRRDGRLGLLGVPQDAEITAEVPVDQGRSYIGASAKAGLLDAVGVGAKLLDKVNPFTTSAEEASILFKNDPVGLKQFHDSPAGVLPRVQEAMNQGSEQTMTELSPPAQALAKTKYATTDPKQAAYLSGQRVVGDALRSLPTSAAMGLSVYFTRGAAAEAEQMALKQGLAPEVAKQAAVKAGSEAMARWSAVTEGTVGYAQQANQVVQQLQMEADDKITAAPLYQQLIAQGYAPEAARERLIQQSSETAGVLAGVVDAAVNAVGGRVFGKILTEGGRLAPRTAKAALTEGATETVQSAGEQLGQNATTQQNVDPEQSLWEGVGENAVQGAVVGGVTGGLFGAVGGAGHDAHAQAPAPAAGAPMPAPAPLDATVPAAAPATPAIAGPAPVQTDTQALHGVMAAPTVDAAIDAAEAAIATQSPAPTTAQSDVRDTMALITQLEQEQNQAPPGAAAVDAIGRILGPDAVAAGNAAVAPPSDIGIPISGQPAEASAPGLLGATEAPSGEMPTKLWTGRRGDGYASELDAAGALTSRRQREPALDWRIEPRGSRFVLAGYAQQSAPETSNVSVPAEVPGVAAGTDRGGLLDATRSVDPGLGDRAAHGPAVDAGGLRAEAASGVVPHGTGEPNAAVGQPLTIQVEGGGPVHLSLFDQHQLPDDSAARTAPGPVITRTQGQHLVTLGAALGKKVVFFHGEEKGAPDGFVYDEGDPHTIYVNQRSSVTPVAVLGHEFWHTVEQTDPEIHAAVSAVVAGRAKPAEVNKEYVGRLGYDESNAHRELTSDLGGDLLNDPTFMPEVFSELERRSPQKARGMIAKLARIFNQVVAKAINAFKGRRDFASQQMVDQLQEVRGAFRKGLADYLEKRGISGAQFESEMAGGKPREQVADERSRFDKVPVKLEVAAADGTKATLKVRDAGAALREYDAREKALEALRTCVGR